MHLDHLPGSFFGPSNLLNSCSIARLHQGDDIGFRFLVDGERELIEWTYADLIAKRGRLRARLQSMDLEGERALLLYPSGWISWRLFSVVSTPA